MDKKKVIKVVAIIIALIIFLFFVFRIITNYSEIKRQDGSDSRDDEYKGDELETQGTVYEESTKSNLIMLKSSIEKYFTFCKEYRDADTPLEIDEIYNLLAREYVEEYNITYNNILQYVTDINATSIRIDKALSTRFVDGSADIYIVQGEALNENEARRQEFSFIVLIDYKNQNYSLCLDDYFHDKGFDDIKAGDRINAITSNIENDNKTYYQYITDEDFLKTTFTEFKNDSIFFIDRAYSHLSDETINSKYHTINEYTQYVNENKRDIYLNEIVTFYTDYDIENNVVTYSCLDKYGKEIVFTFYSLTNYKVTLND